MPNIYQIVHLDTPVELDVMYKDKIVLHETFITINTNKVCMTEINTANWNLDEISMGAEPFYKKPKLRVRKYKSKFQEQKIIAEDRI